MFSYYVIESILKGKQSVVDLYREASYKTSEASNALGSLKKQEQTGKIAAKAPEIEPVEDEDEDVVAENYEYVKRQLA